MIKCPEFVRRLSSLRDIISRLNGFNQVTIVKKLRQNIAGAFFLFVIEILKII